MRIPRLRRPAGRLSVIILIGRAVWLSSRAASAADRELTGVVVDQSGQALPRAYVRLLDGSPQSAATFADEAGRFRLRTGDGDCRIEASLTGFETAAVACGPTPVRIVLTVAPVHETIVVSATRTEAPADQVGASVTTFTAADLQRRQIPLVADLLRASPGVMVVRSGGAGALTSLFVRGGESNYNKVLLDGIPLNEPGGTFNFGNLTTDNLDRVEIVRGAHSALFGSDAMASVVQLVTKRPDRSRTRPQGTVSVEGGSYGTLRGGGAASGASAPPRLRGGRPAIQHRQSRAEQRVREYDGVCERRRGRHRHGHHPVHRPRRASTAWERPGRPRSDGRISTRSSSGMTASAASPFDHQVNSALPAARGVLAGRVEPAIDESRDRPSLRAALRYARRSIHVLRFSVRQPHGPSAGITQATRVTGGLPPPLPTAITSSRSSRTGTANARRSKTGSRRPSLQRRVTTSAGRSSIRRCGGRVFSTAGGRIERNDSFGTAFVPRGSIVFVLRSSRGGLGETKLRASGGLGIKEPTVLESFSPSPFFRGNPDLRPERSRTAEVGIEQRFAADRAKVDVIWFENRFSDRISLRTTNPATFEAQYFNIGLSRARGSEVSVEAAPTRGFRARAGYTFVASRVVESTAPDNVVLQAGNWMFRRPRHSGFAGATWNLGRLSADVDGLFIGRFVDSDFSSLRPPILQNDGYATWNARIAWKVTPRFAGTLAIDNLANADYMEALGYQALRRAARVGVRVGF